MIQFGLEDPCGDYLVKKDVLFAFVKSLNQEENIMNNDSIMASIVMEYIKEFNNLHEMRGLQPPVDLNSKHTQAASLIANLCREEDVARCHAPLSHQITAKLIEKGNDVNSLSKQALIKDILSTFPVSLSHGPARSSNMQPPNQISIPIPAARR
jgi:hypothetical protein